MNGLGSNSSVAPSTPGPGATETGAAYEGSGSLTPRTAGEPLADFVMQLRDYTPTVRHASGFI